MSNLRAAIMTLVLLTVLPAPALADSFDKGMAAYEAKNFKKARAVFSELANAGHPKAQYWLGAMNEFGLGGAVDRAAALKWYSSSAKEENSDAQYALGEKLLTGNGIDSNPAEAVSWWRKAASHGHLTALLQLAICYRDGTGVPADIVMAHVYASIRVREWGKMDLAERDKISKELAAQLTEAQRTESEELQWKGMSALNTLPLASKTGQK